MWKAATVLDAFSVRAKNAAMLEIIFPRVSHRSIANQDHLTVVCAHSKNICVTKYAHRPPCFISDGGIIGDAAQ